MHVYTNLSQTKLTRLSEKSVTPPPSNRLQQDYPGYFFILLHKDKFFYVHNFFSSRANRQKLRKYNCESHATSCYKFSTDLIKTKECMFKFYYFRKIRVIIRRTKVSANLKIAKKEERNWAFFQYWKTRVKFHFQL